MVCEGMRREKNSWGKQASRHTEKHPSQCPPSHVESHIRDLLIKYIVFLSKIPGEQTNEPGLLRANLTPTFLLTLELPFLEVLCLPLQIEAVENLWEQRVPKSLDFLPLRLALGG